MIHYCKFCKRTKTSSSVYYYQMYKRIFKAFLVSNTYLSNKYVGIIDTWQSRVDLDSGHWSMPILVENCRYGRYLLGKVVLTAKGQRRTHTHLIRHNSVNLAYWHSREFIITFYSNTFYTIISYTEDNLDNWPKPVKVAGPRVCFLASSHTD